MPTFIHHKGARHTIGADRDETRVPCANYGAVYDELTDNLRPDDDHVQAARNLCGTCILSQPEVAKPCLRAAMSRGDRWARHVLDARPAPTITDKCGTKTGAERHYRAGETCCQPCRDAEARYRAARKAAA